LLSIINRRDFLKAGALAAASSLMPWRGLFAEDARPVVWEIKGEAGAAVEKVFASLGGMESLLSVKPGTATVLLKPNLCLPHPPASATTTSPELIDALCACFARQGVKSIVVADHTLQATERFKNNQVLRVADKYKQAGVLLADERRYYTPVEVPGKVLKHTEKLELLDGADLVVNVATAKNHSATGVSLAIKNLMGLIWNRTEFHVRLDLSRAIGDLALAVRPDINIIDASRVLLGGGPTGPGPILREDRIFASTDIVAVDSVVTARYEFGGRRLMPRQVPHLRAAYENGAGEIDLKKIDLRTAQV
jgi:uncharacterized protein (DUF362 family)